MRAMFFVGAASAVAILGGCGPASKAGGCKDQIEPGDLVITEVFADSKAPPGGSGTDVGKEWFEVYNATGRPVDLEGLVLVNGRPDGSKQKEHTITQQTIAPDQHLTLGNATVDTLPAYIDYGFGPDLGDFFNTDGGKLVLRCGDRVIDDAEYQMVKEGHSRQLTAAQAPDYTLNDDQMNWCEAADTEFEPGNFGTPGADNDCTPVVFGQCSDGGTMRDAILPMPGQLVITELMPSPAGDDNTQEWFEAKATAAFDLNGLGLDRAGDTAMPSVIESADCIHVNAGDYVVFAKSTDMALDGGLPAAAIKGTFKFSMVGGSPTAPGDVAIVAAGTVIDSVTYTKSTTGKALQLDPDLVDPAANDEESNFCDATRAYGPGGTGTPGELNDQCMLMPPAGQCSAGGVNRPVVTPAPGSLVVTEFLANPAGTGTDATQEWFEIANVGAAAFDLNGLGLKGNATTVNLVQSADCKPVAAGGFALFAHTADPTMNAMLPVVDATFTFALAQSNGSISVLDGATVLDTVTWTTGIAEGASKQLDPDLTTTTANDLPASFCTGTAPYGDMTNKGTPKAANVQCP